MRSLRTKFCAFHGGKRRHCEIGDTADRLFGVSKMHSSSTAVRKPMGGGILQESAFSNCRAPTISPRQVPGKLLVQKRICDTAINVVQYPTMELCHPFPPCVEVQTLCSTFIPTLVTVYFYHYSNINSRTPTVLHTCLKLVSIKILLGSYRIILAHP